MKTYKDFEKIYIGESDIASLVLVGYNEDIGTNSIVLPFGSDDEYSAYLVTEKDVEIGSHYKIVAMFEAWLKIYDDTKLVRSFKANKIVVYRAGEMGCIIHLINEKQ